MIMFWKSLPAALCLLLCGPPADTAQADPAPITVTVDWNHVVAQATPRAYGLNAFRGFDPAITANPAYQKNLKYMAPGLLRLHNGGLMGDSVQNTTGWIDHAHRRWDAAKIKAALAGFPPGATLLINIPTWPDWMDADGDGFLDAGQTAAYARLCAELVRLVGQDCKRPGALWEVTNEQDERYFVNFHTGGGWGPLKDSQKPDRVEELAAIYAQCAAAMKSADPTIRVGGPAMERPDLTPVIRRFVRAAGPHLDFFSYHIYASGSAADSDETIFNHAQGFGDVTQAVAEAVRAEKPGRPIPIFFDEYNISADWETRDARMTNVKGAVFDALAMTAAVTHGAAGTAAWNECDGIYGKMDDRYRLRPSATLFHWLNADMIGAVVSTAGGDPQTVVAYAVKTAAGRKSLLLVNRSPREQRVTLAGWSTGRTTQRQLTAAGEAATPFTGSAATLPAASVTLLTAGQSQPLAQAHPLLHHVAQTLIKANDGGVGGAHLKVDFATAQRLQPGFGLFHHAPPQPLPLAVGGDRQRVKPPTMAVIARHDSCRNALLDDAHQEQLRLHLHLALNVLAWVVWRHYEAAKLP